MSDLEENIDLSALMAAPIADEPGAPEDYLHTPPEDDPADEPAEPELSPEEIEKSCQRLKLSIQYYINEFPEELAAVQEAAP